ncbi:thiamine biosynthesis tRNA modification protein ThiI [Agrilactobacillus composti DSM 18527 = JCM 14202]|uniref:Probable tRNA sulfurtransferase n=1 Tax=Agrilactobacillus composti DSM 18527 = JCM 14202 TaxID=1423734 RepID=X0PTG0_9LACO|nr:tRNA uracil 4-sulfurtransferase ThiI [Agrilactobacillus composti]KRM36671.1 thiamine biosynthesis tRNA modification protein ThiI [Agrilactobacillus composti DSM 18527 = JCM 14202]GAF40571.1 tRNA S(4)U 4-thiouridine synthase [Agrilactobacillus composti DSM 18527 = JCM 14202]
MEYTEIMARYGELSTKGKNRKDFIGRLNGNITKALRPFTAIRIHPKRDRMHIVLNGESAQDVMTALDRVFGIQTYSPVIRIEATDFEQVKAVALEMVNEAAPKAGMSFKINTRRSNHEYPLDTNDINLALGDFISDARPDLVVKMKQPDVKVRVEVRHDGFYLSYLTVQGALGLPVGTAGKAVLMLSGGIDSPVAAYLALKRGVAIEMVHFFSPPYTTENALKKAKELTAKVAAYAGPVTFIQVPFTEIQEEIKEKVPEGYLMTVQRRFMLRLTDKIRAQRDGLAIFNGESVGQVASQTLSSMAAINDVTTTPIIRPVATLDKNEIIDIARKIDTFDLSVQPFEDCCTIFAPPQPKTHPNLEKTRHYEQALDVDALEDKAMANLTISTIQVGDKFLGQNADAAEISQLL